MSRSVPRRSGRGGDVEEDELVGALGRVALGELGRIALVDEVDEAGALDHAAVRDVEARDHPPTEHQAARTQVDEVGQQPQAVLAASLGVELDAEQRPTCDGRGERSAVLGRGEDEVVLGGAEGARIRMDEVEVGVRGDPVEERMRPRPDDLVPADVRQGGGILEADRPTRGDPDVVAPSSSLRSKRSWSPRQIPRNGRSAAIQSRMGLDEAVPGETRHGRRRRSDTRHDHGIDVAQAFAVVGDQPALRADRPERLVDADQVAGAVVDDRDPRCGGHGVTPGHPLSRRHLRARG